jgi:hypothetical protein
MESESVRSSDDEVIFSLLRFPVVNIKLVVLRSHRYPVASRYEQHDAEEYEDEQTENDDHNDFLHSSIVDSVAVAKAGIAGIILLTTVDSNLLVQEITASTILT